MKRTALDDGGRDEAAQLGHVGDVYRDAERARFGGELAMQFRVVSGGIREDASFNIAGRIVTGDVGYESARNGGLQVAATGAG